MLHDRVSFSARWRARLRHLRLHFQPLLAPIYLFGALVGAEAAGVARPLSQPEVWLAVLSLHVFLYGGTTAFNSYYDRDEGPVGGMLQPPPVDAGLLPFSLAVQAMGLALALPVGWAFTGAWLLLFAVFTAYSHPAIRLKARPWAALAAIALGQGAVGFALGWLTLAPAQGLTTPASALRMAVTALIVTGLYVVTQSYQVGEDRARGDRTLPVLLGPRRALRTAVALLAPGGVVLLVDLARLGGAGIAGAAAVFFAGLAVWILAWSARFDATRVAANYRVAMAIASTVGVGLGGLLLALLAAR